MYVCIYIYIYRYRYIDIIHIYIGIIDPLCSPSPPTSNPLPFLMSCFLTKWVIAGHSMC